MSAFGALVLLCMADAVVIIVVVSAGQWLDNPAFERWCYARYHTVRQWGRYVRYRVLRVDKKAHGPDL